MARMAQFNLRQRSQPGEMAVWRDQQFTSDPIPSDASFAFFIHGDNEFLGRTAQDWSAERTTNDTVLYLSNRAVAGQKEQSLRSSEFETLPKVGRNPRFPDRFTEGTKLEVIRWWSGDVVWSGTMPASGMIELPDLPCAKYVLRGDGHELAFCGRQAIIGPIFAVIELGIADAGPDAASTATLQFEAPVVRFEYVIASSDPAKLREQGMIIGQDGEVVADPVSSRPQDGPRTTRFRTRERFELKERASFHHVLITPSQGSTDRERMRLPAPSPQYRETRDGEALATIHVYLNIGRPS